MTTRKPKEDFNFHCGQLPRPARSEPSGRRCDIKNLQLYQNQGTHAGPADESKSQPSIHSLKRDAMTKQNASGSLPKATDREIVRNQSKNSISWGIFINKHKDHDFCSELFHSDEINTARDFHCSIKYFFDLNSDNTTAASGFPGGREDSGAFSRHLYHFRAFVSRSTKAPSGDVHRMTIFDFNLSDWGPKEFDKYSKQSVKLEKILTTSADGTEPYIGLDIEPEPEILLQSVTRAISHDQLVVEVKGIYAGLVMSEAKCIAVDEKHFMEAQGKTPSRQTKPSSKQWQALIVLHKTLLHEHHDFFLASQHPSASSALSRLTVKYSMPAKM